jgi:hypothetical protein
MMEEVDFDHLREAMTAILRLATVAAQEGEVRILALEQIRAIASANLGLEGAGPLDPDTLRAHSLSNFTRLKNTWLLWGHMTLQEQREVLASEASMQQASPVCIAHLQEVCSLFNQMFPSNEKEPNHA